MIREKLDNARFVPLSKEVLKEVNLEDYLVYLRYLRYYKHINNIAPIDYTKKNTYPSSRIALKANRVLLDHQKYKIINDSRTKTDKPILYCVSHIGKFDYQIVYEAINDYAVPLAGDPETLVRTFDGAFLERNQIIYVDVNDELDRYISELSMIDVLEHKVNGLIYPEGFWNVTSNELMMDLYPGAIRMAIYGDAVIVPCCIEKYDKYFFVNIGENFILDNNRTDKEYIEDKKYELRDIMSKLKLNIYEYTKKGVKDQIYIRNTMGTYESEAKKFQDSVFNEYLDKDKKPIFSMDTVEKRAYKPKNKYTGYLSVKPKEAFSYLNLLKLNKNNAFMFRNDSSILPIYQKSLNEEYQKSLMSNAGALESVEEIKQLLLK